MSEYPELEAVVTPLRSSFHAKRRDRVAQCEAISQALEAYVKAVDSTILRELASQHNLPVPAPTPAPERLALELLSKVQKLPELQQLIAQSTPQQASPMHAETSTVVSERCPVTPSVLPAAKPNGAPSSLTNGSWPLVRRALAAHPLVIVGGAPHLERLTNLSDNMKEQIEWVDTTRQGTHAIGNLERRIKDGRIAALVILEGLVQHRHSDPLVSTARSAKVPHAYGGKGGRAALTQAVDELERMLQNPR
jgi:hypothetical protein